MRITGSARGLIRLVLVVAFLPLGEASSQTVAAQQAPSGSAAGGRVVLRLSAQTNRANVCTPVWVTATLRSEEEKALTVVQQRTVPAVVLTVTGPDGAPVPRTRYGEALQTMRTETSQSFKQILPGESVEEYILLNQAFDLSLTGNYAIVARRQVFLDAGGGKSRSIVVSSEPLRVTILPPNKMAQPKAASTDRPGKGHPLPE